MRKWDFLIIYSTKKKHQQSQRLSVHLMFRLIL
nr:MAG TPA: hypothetical protein [Caudoviricetes sp.]